MGQDPGTIRQEIEETRQRVGEEVEALSYKTDVGARLDDYVDGKREAVVERVAGARDAVTSAVGDVVPGSGGLTGRLHALDGLARRNPLGLVVAGVGVGAVAGMLVPSSRTEDRAFGELATQVKDTAREVGDRTVEHGAQVAQATVETLASESAEHGKDLVDELTNRADTAAEPHQTRA